MPTSTAEVSWDVSSQRQGSDEHAHQIHSWPFSTLWSPPFTGGFTCSQDLGKTHRLPRAPLHVPGHLPKAFQLLETVVGVRGRKRT